jgi:hypothetical protein
MNPVYIPAMCRPLLATALGMAVLTAGSIARANAPADMLQTAETACLEKAASDGWRADQASVVSRRAIDDDRVEIVLDLTKDGVNTARLTCPFSIRSGVVGQIDAMGEALKGGAERTDFGQDFVRSMATAADATQAVNRNHAWWMLLPIGLAGISWAALRGRDGEDLGYGGAELPRGGRTGGSFTAAASGKHGEVVIHDLADQQSLVRRRVMNGQMVSLTGRSASGWLEVDGGGWVLESDLKIRENASVSSTRRG